MCGGLCACIIGMELAVWSSSSCHCVWNGNHQLVVGQILTLEEVGHVPGNAQ